MITTIITTKAASHSRPKGETGAEGADGVVVAGAGIVVAMAVVLTGSVAFRLVATGMPLLGYLQPHFITPLGHEPIFPQIVPVGHVTLLQLTHETRLAAEIREGSKSTRDASSGKYHFVFMAIPPLTYSNS